MVVACECVASVPAIYARHVAYSNRIGGGTDGVNRADFRVPLTLLVYRFRFCVVTACSCVGVCFLFIF